jgi:hypothetical protein
MRGHWRTAIHGRGGHLLEAALLLAAVGLGGQEAKGPEWVHQTYDRGQIQESWLSLVDGRTYAVRSDGDVVFVDHAANLRQWYRKGGHVILEDRPAPNRDAAESKWERKTPWDMYVRVFEDACDRPRDDSRAAKGSETIDGMVVTRFDLYRHDALDKEVLSEQLWVDAEKRRPIRHRRALQAGEREREGQDWVTAVYDYPETGPGSIYELGVPRDTPMVKSGAADMPPDVKELMSASEKARDAFPRRYQVAVWDSDPRNATIDVMRCDGSKARQDRYFSHPGSDPRNPAPLTDPAEAILGWAARQTALDTFLVDGTRCYRRTIPPPTADSDAAPMPLVRVTGAGSRYFGRDTDPREYQWQFIDHAGPFHIVEHPLEAPGGCICLQWEAGAGRQDYYVDPNRDYICVKVVTWQRRLGFFEKRSEDWLLDFERLPDRQWYATRRLRFLYGDRTRGLSPSWVDWHVDITAPTAEFPPGTFDGSKLLEGAKVETEPD